MLFCSEGSGEWGRVGVLAKPRLTKATEHLARLGEVFSVRHAALSLGVLPATASVYLDRWKAAGQVAIAGERTGWWHNLVKNPRGGWTGETILTVLPSATLIGESVLHSVSVITQIPQEITLAVQAKKSYPTFHGLYISGKPNRWFERWYDQLVSQEQCEWSTYGLKALTPEAALLDLYATEGAWHPDPDDLDVDDEMASRLSHLLTGSEVPWQLQELGITAPVPRRRLRR